MRWTVRSLADTHSFGWLLAGWILTLPMAISRRNGDVRSRGATLKAFGSQEGGILRQASDGKARRLFATVALGKRGRCGRDKLSSRLRPQHSPSVSPTPLVQTSPE
jgi:hypothetical protein